MNVDSISLKGLRESNEDKYNIIINEDGHIQEYVPINYFGIYDGHGGKYVSTYLSENLPVLFMDNQLNIH